MQSPTFEEFVFEWARYRRFVLHIHRGCDVCYFGILFCFDMDDSQKIVTPDTALEPTPTAP